MVSIIIVSYNRLDLVQKCLTAAVKNAPPETEIILVDNASTEDISGLVKKGFPQVKLITNKENLGFSTANNQAMKIARGDYLLLVNTDAFVEPGSIEALRKFLGNHPDAGVVAPQLRNSDGTIQPSGGFHPHLYQVFLIATFLDNLPFLRRFLPSIHIRWPGYFTIVRQLGWVAGAFLMLPQKVFTRTGGFDEKIFMYGEELEWCYRIKLAGYKIYLDPEIHITHLGFASSRSRRFGIIKEYESWLAFYRKHKPSWQRPVLLALITLACFLRIIRYALTNNREMVRTYILALQNIFTLKKQHLFKVKAVANDL